jgi:hypothetical protein
MGVYIHIEDGDKYYCERGKFVLRMKLVEMGTFTDTLTAQIQVLI